MAAQLEFDIADRDGKSRIAARQIVSEKIPAGQADGGASVDRSSIMIIIIIIIIGPAESL